MIYSFLPVDLIFFGAAIISLFVAVIIFIKKVEPGGTAFGFTMLAIALWLFFRVFEGVSEDIASKIFWAKFEYLGITMLPASYFIFSSRFCRKDEWITKLNLFLTYLVPIITLILVFTNEYHGLIWKEIYPSNIPGVENLVYVHGLFFWVNMLYSYILLLWGIYRLVKAFLNFSKSYRLQGLLLVFATLIPWLGNLLYLFGLSPIKGMDLTPMGLSFTGLIIAVSIYKGQIFQVAPVARNIIFDTMQEGILVLDLKGNIVDGNIAAENILEIPLKELLKKPFTKPLSKYPVLVENLQKQSSTKFETCLDQKTFKYVQISISLIIKGMNPTGQLIVLQDISKRKQLEIYEKEQRKYAEALARIAATLNSSLNLEIVLEKMLDILHEVVPHDAANVALVKDESVFHFVKIKGYKEKSKKTFGAYEYKVDDIPGFKQMASTKEALVITDTVKNSLWVALPDTKWVRSYIGSPIVVEGKVIGFINVDSKTPNFFTQEQAERLKVFADEAAIAIQNARYVEELRERNQDLTTLYEVGLSMTKELNDHEIVDGLIKQIEHFKEIDIFLLMLFNDALGKSTVYFFSLEKNKLQSTEVDNKKISKFIELVVENKKTLYLPRFDDPEMLEGLLQKKDQSFENMRTCLGIPLIKGKETIGILSVFSKTEDSFNQKQIQLLETIGSQLSITFQNVKMYERMKELAIIDELTGIYNRRFFYLAANKAINRSIRYHKKLSLILIDIDHYKDVNDHFGHIAGDKVLQRITQVIQKELRESDIFSRYGGEEFLILLSDTGVKAAVAVAERLRQRVEELHVKYNEEEISVTISLGVTQMTADRTMLQELIAVVDQALYGAKQKGRNRVEFIV